MKPKLKAPFPYFGGKSTVAPEIWSRFGQVIGYVEPFAGSLAVLLGNPQWQCKIETVNDLDGYVANFWRAVRAEPEAVAEHADWPVNELDMLSRHKWLSKRKPEFSEKLKNDPDLFDVKMAGWWVWGAQLAIGNHWGRNYTGCIFESSPKPVCIDFKAISNRLRNVRVACGDWARICTPAFTYSRGLTAVFLDPPYATEKRDKVYCEDSFTVAHDVRKWCIENGDNPLLRIALCGYDEHNELEAHGWTPFYWKAQGGYANQGSAESQGKKNKLAECIMFSPHCVGKGLFE